MAGLRPPRTGLEIVQIVVKHANELAADGKPSLYENAAVTLPKPKPPAPIEKPGDILPASVEPPNVR